MTEHEYKQTREKLMDEHEALLKALDLIYGKTRNFVFVEREPVEHQIEAIREKKKLRFVKNGSNEVCRKAINAAALTFKASEVLAVARSEMPSMTRNPLDNLLCHMVKTSQLERIDKGVYRKKVG